MRSIPVLTALCLAAALSAQSRTVTFTPFGVACGADLAASLVRAAAGATVRVDLTNAAPGSVAVLVAGQQVPNPTPLPNSNCGLLVQPRATFVAVVDAVGAAAFRFVLPPISPLSLDFQAVTIALLRNGRTAESSNGIHLSVQ